MSKDDRESAITAIYASLPESARRRANSRSQEYRLMKQDTDGRISRSADAPVALGTQKGYATLKKSSSPIPSSINRFYTRRYLTIIFNRYLTNNIQPRYLTTNILPSLDTYFIA
jgi:hypothetical protein